MERVGESSGGTAGGVDVFAKLPRPGGWASAGVPVKAGGEEGIC